MMTKVSSAEIRSYNGELRQPNDDREAQVLKEYDEVFGLLLAKGNEHKLELPPLFQKEFIDHGALTNANEKSADIKEGLQEFMDYIEMFDLYDLLVPTSNHLGYRIDSTDARIPQNIKAAILQLFIGQKTTVNR